MKGRLLLDVVIRKSAAILELLAGEDQALLVRGDSLLVWSLSVILPAMKDFAKVRTLNLGLDIVDGVG